MGVSRAGCRFEFFLGCVRLAKTEILSDRPVNEIGVLHDHGDMTPHDLQGQGAQVVSPEQDAPLLGIKETQEKPDQRRFASTTRSHDTETLTGLDREADIMQHVWTLGIAKIYPVEGNFRGERQPFFFWHRWLTWLLYHWHSIQDGKNGFRGGHGNHAAMVQARELTQRTEAFYPQHEDA